MDAVRFFGPIGRSTGYGVAVRNMALAFSESGIPTKFAFRKDAAAKNKGLISKLQGYDGRTKIDFYMQAPPWNRHRSRNYKIGYFYWEADTLPPGWVRHLNFVQELWAPCELIANAYKKAGFKGRIKVVPTPSEPWNHSDKIYIPSDVIPGYVVSDETYKFYSIFQWHERKGYRELLSAYYKTFSDKDNVILMLKVNPLNVGNMTVDGIRNDIFKIKSSMSRNDLPPVYLMTSIVPVEKIQAIHNTGDCYVSPHHGEGWGMPIHDAMMSGNEIIVTKFGGVTEWLDNSSARIIPHRMGAVSGMNWMSSLYVPSQKWAYPSINGLSKLMADAYNEQGSSGRGKRAKIISDDLTIDSVASIIKKELGKGR